MVGSLANSSRLWHDNVIGSSFQPSCLLLGPHPHLLASHARRRLAGQALHPGAASEDAAHP